MVRSWLLWSILALLLLTSGFLLYRACGIQFFGFGMRFCEPSRPAAADELAALTLRLRELEQQHALAPICEPARPLPPSQPGIAGIRDGTSGIAAGTPAAPGVDGDGGSGDGSGTGADAPGGAPLGPGAMGSDPSGSNESAEGTPSSPQGESSATPSSEGASGPLRSAEPNAAGEGPSSAGEPSLGEAPSAESPSAEPPSSERPGNQASQPSSASQQQAVTDCPTTTSGSKPTVVLALDHSKSMGLPADLDDQTVRELDALIASGDETAAWTAQTLYDDYVSQPGRKRLDELKEAVREAGQDRDLALVTFAGCSNGVKDLGSFDDSDRRDFLAAVDGLTIRPATPLAEAVRQSVARARALEVDGTRILLVSDGIDTCGGDPCAAARESAGVPIDVISLGDSAALSCVAEASGGRVLERSDTLSLRQAITQALAPPESGPC